MSVVKNNFCVNCTLMGDKSIVHNLKLIALSVVISVNISIAQMLINFLEL